MPPTKNLWEPWWLRHWETPTWPLINWITTCLVWTERYLINWTEKPLPFSSYWLTSNSASFLMDQLLNEINAESGSIGYRRFIRELITQAIVRKHFSFDTVNTYLSELHKEIYNDLCENTIIYYNMFATEEFKSQWNLGNSEPTSFGNWTCPGNDVT